MLLGILVFFFGIFADQLAHIRMELSAARHVYEDGMSRHPEE